MNLPPTSRKFRCARWPQHHLRHRPKLLILLKTQESERRVVCLIDGDEMTFSLSQIAKGTAGGRVVAATLMDALKHLADHSQITIRAWVFFNKNEILKVSGIRGNSDVSRGIEDFVVGFNRTNDRFLMADVGTGKVSPKVKGHSSCPCPTDHPQNFSFSVP